MSTRNDVTGDELTSRHTNDQYRQGWDRIFGKKPNREPMQPQGESDASNGSDTSEQSDSKQKSEN